MYRFILFLLIATAVFYSGCGIPNIPYIDPPTVSSPNTDWGTYQISFNNASDNNPIYFFGYSLYYRFYSTKDDLESAVEELKSADDLKDLQDKDYIFLYRMNENTGETGNAGKPITIPIDESDRNDSFTITLDFNDDIVFVEDESDLFGTTITFKSSTVYLGRYVEQNRIDSSSIEDPVNISFKSTAFSEDDSDLPGTSDFSFGTDQYLYLSVYVLSYGKDETWIPIYSEPVNLGRFEIPVSTF